MEKRYYYITPTDYETAEANGISAQLLEQRVRSSLWDIDKAVATPKKQRQCFKKTWRKWKNVAIGNGVDRENFRNRVRTLGWDEEAAATTKKGRAKFRMKWTEEELETARRNGIDGNSMAVPRMRITRLGWSREDAVNIPKITEKERQKRVAEGTRKYHEKRGVNSGFKQIG